MHRREKRAVTMLPLRLLREPIAPPDAAAPEVLLLERDPLIRAPLIEALRDEGYRVGWMENGLVALAQLQARSYKRLRLPDVVIADMDLPGFSGVEVAAALRHVQRPPLVILMAANGSKRVRLLAREVEAFAFFEKPICMRGVCDFLATELERTLPEASRERP
jgi:DNA-binding response OmpR family regulator